MRENELIYLKENYYPFYTTFHVSLVYSTKLRQAISLILQILFVKINYIFDISYRIFAFDIGLVI